MNKWTLLRAMGLTSVVISIACQVAYAEGPGTGGRKIKLDGESAGPYMVRVVISPTPPRVENTYLEVRVIDPTTGVIITDGEVTVQAISGSSLVEAVASHDIAPIPDEYAAHLPIPFAEVWEISVKIEGYLGVGEVTFLERISNPNSIAPILSVGLPVLGLLALSLVFYRLQRSSNDTATAASDRQSIDRELSEN